MKEEIYNFIEQATLKRIGENFYPFSVSLVVINSYFRQYSRFKIRISLEELILEGRIFTYRSLNHIHYSTRQLND